MAFIKVSNGLITTTKKVLITYVFSSIEKVCLWTINIYS